MFKKIKSSFNLLRKKRDLNLCIHCPVKGWCCYHSVYIEAPNQSLCQDCPEKIWKNCNFPKERLGASKKIYNIIMPNQKCKFLGKDGLCTVFDERFERNRNCHTIKKGITKGTWLKECLYVHKNKKYLNDKPKVFYDDVKDNLCDLGKLTYNLTNKSHHEGIYGIFKY